MNKKELQKKAWEALERRGVNLVEVAKVVYDLQVPYQHELTLDECYEKIEKVLKKTEVAHAVLTGVELDELAEKKQISMPLQELLENDEALYGVDEILALSIVNLFGSIALTNFGYLDKAKPGIIGDFNNKKNGDVHTFLDDILCAIAASACALLAHSAE